MKIQKQVIINTFRVTFQIPWNSKKILNKFFCGSLSIMGLKLKILRD